MDEKFKKLKRDCYINKEMFKLLNKTELFLIVILSLMSSFLSLFNLGTILAHIFMAITFIILDVPTGDFANVAIKYNDLYNKILVTMSPSALAVVTMSPSALAVVTISDNDTIINQLIREKNQIDEIAPIFFLKDTLEELIANEFEK